MTKSSPGVRVICIKNLRTARSCVFMASFWAPAACLLRDSLVVDMVMTAVICHPFTARNKGLDPAELAAFYENEFGSHMGLLNVLPPTIVLRVTEHIDEVIRFIEGIVARGHAYIAEGSVYFDTTAFGAESLHTYGKLHPKRQQHRPSSGVNGGTVSPKRSPSDFVLWKEAKKDEPSWNSPWGQGRPGWHIECSAMASSVFGAQLDIHSGGVDLAFPHHENEMAQSESFHCCPQWGGMYLHSGHVMLEDTKISKSLGNTIGVLEILKVCTPDQFRCMCLLRRYSKSFNFNEAMLARAIRMEQRLRTFLLDCFAVIKAKPRARKPHAAGMDLLQSVATARSACDAALRNDFDTESVMLELAALAKRTRRYIVDTDASEGPDPGVLNVAAGFVSDTLELLGMDPNGKLHQLATRVTDNSNGGDLTPVVDRLVMMRSTSRGLALNYMRGGHDAGPGAELAEAVLAECDATRRELAELTPGVALQDKKGKQNGTWLFIKQSA